MTSIGDYAFNDCIGLTSITIPNSVKSIGIGAFYGCSELTTITIPNSVMSIGGYAFNRCSGLTSITIGNSVTSIEDYTFTDCSGLTSITIPNSVTSIGRETFRGCSSLTSIIIPNSVTSIGAYAFYNCIGLVSITIPNSVTSIGLNAFELNDIVTVVSLIENPFAIQGRSSYKRTFSENTFYNATLYVPEGTIENYKATKGWKDFVFIKEIDREEYKLTYLLDGNEYKSYIVESGSTITPENAPTKEGYTFSGWSEIPETMPAHDVTVTGSFSINKYKLTYTVDGAEYKTFAVEYGATITPEAEPAKEGYTFSGWSEIPETMPAHDVTVAGTFSINKYKLIYTIDGEEYKSYEVEYGATITPEPTPTKEGYTFSGWSEIPERMPAHDVIVTGTFTINKYSLIYLFDGEEYRIIVMEYNSTINTETEPTKEGYTFAGWFLENGDTIPETMPAHDLTVVAKFVPNTYQLTYMIGEEVYKIVTYEYGADIIPESQPEGDYVTFEWTDLPQTMPAHDVVVYAKFTTAVMDMSIKTHQDAQYYSLDGQRMAKPRRGVIVVRSKNGGAKKVVVK